MPSDEVSRAIGSLLETYNELNSARVDELHEEPSALDFMRYVAQNRPFVLRQGCASWKAVRDWDACYLVDSVGNSDVSVAITPLGNADSVLPMPDGSPSFVKPLERSEKFHNVLNFISTQEATGNPIEPIKYAQTQNDNLRGEYAELFKDVPADIPFVRIALQKHPDAVNLWLGNSRSVTAMHKDNYENIYAQVRGRKHFVLLPPITAPCTNERSVDEATYVAVHIDDAETLEVRLDEPPRKVPVPIWDPDMPSEHANRFSALAEPLRVTLDEGDLLYLPAMWFHKVSQSCGEEGFCCAVNYWYDMDFSGSFWATNAFIRDIGNVSSSSWS